MSCAKTAAAGIDRQRLHVSQRAAGETLRSDQSQRHRQRNATVTLPPDSPRGGMLTHGTVLIVTSNPTRTSPVKRGLFILDNFLGTPPPPPPPDIPPLEDAEKEFKDRKPRCAKRWVASRTTVVRFLPQAHGPARTGAGEFQRHGHVAREERGQPIDAAGKLITGETFTNCELKGILVENHARISTVPDRETAHLRAGPGPGVLRRGDGGPDRGATRTGADAFRLLAGVIESAPFQKRELALRPRNCHQPSP